MKKVLLFVLIVCISLSLIGCTSKMSEEEYGEFESEFHYKMKDVISYIETNLGISETEESRRIIADYVETAKEDLETTIKQSKGKVPKDKKEAFKSMKDTSEDGIFIIGNRLKHTYEPDGKETINEVLSEWKTITGYNEYKKSDNVWEEKPVIKKTFETQVEEYMEYDQLSLTWRDIQYDMPNNLDKRFLVAGVAELSDYYNYGFRGKENEYFCVSVTPYDGKYTNRWHLYLEREKFEEVFNSLKAGNKTIIATCEIPEDVYKKGQGNMAFLRRLNK